MKTAFIVEVTPDHNRTEEFDDYAAAVAYADAIADDAEANAVGPYWKADRSWASRDNMYCIRYGATTIQIVRAEEEEEKDEKQAMNYVERIVKHPKHPGQVII